MDGVIWKDGTPLANLENIFQVLNSHNISYAFATNNSMKTPKSYQMKLSNFNLMKAKYPDGGPVYIVGEAGLIEPLGKNGFFHQKKDVLAVVGGLDKMINYKKLSEATLNLSKVDTDFYFTNIDSTYPTPEGNLPGAGSILAILETASGRKAKVTGKPDPLMFQQALEYLKTPSTETIVIGDRLNTDILGGINADCMTALLLSGVTNIHDIETSNVKPDIIAKDIRNFLE